MWREFFCDTKGLRRACAWSGLLVFFGHELFRAYLKWALNDWYESFYDVLQTTIERRQGDDVENDLRHAREQVVSQLMAFATVVAPALVVHPLAGLVRNLWVYDWRRTLMHSYIGKWNQRAEKLEGSSQRIHEDTQRFSSGIQGCISTLIESILTLAVFCPVLYSLDPSLMWIAILSALGGIAISAFVGQKLVGLEVNNQVAEAALRTNLVLIEKCQSNTESFSDLIKALTRNYTRLYTHFAALSTWLSAFDQFSVVLPYLLVAPRLFAEDETKLLTLGQLVKITNSFSKVFDSMNIVSNNYLAINEWRSVLRRLSQFERQVISYNERLDDESVRTSLRTGPDSTAPMQSAMESCVELDEAGHN